jgi:UDP:flavonoid glycosyltransferase YjiC (YdhE family)
VNAYMTDRFDPTDVLLADGASRSKRALTSFAGRRIQAAQKRSLATPFRDVASAHGIRELTSLYDFLEGDLTLIADLPALCPVQGLPESFRYIGPLVWEPPEGETAALLDGIGSSRPLVYATAGNTGAARMIELVLDAFASQPGYEVILSAGAYLELPSKVPPNVHPARFVQGSQVLRRAVAAIHCGGNGSTYQALGEGLPAIVVPFNTDQRINAWLVKRHHLGIPLDVTKADGRHLAAAVDVVRDDPDLRGPLLRFQELVRASDGPGAAADAILELAAAER